jgi:hypothetical protein
MIAWSLPASRPNGFRIQRREQRRKEMAAKNNDLGREAAGCTGVLGRP